MERGEVNLLHPFWEKLQPVDNGCSVWTGAADPYGRTRFQGRSRLAHRVAFYLAFGWWPRVVMHKCDNPPCCNPAHLVGGTPLDNMRDKVARGRWRGNTRLGPAQCRALVWAWGTGLVSKAELGRWFGVSDTQVGNVVRREQHDQVV